MLERKKEIYGGTEELARGSCQNFNHSLLKLVFK
jgi:hypothetical protein